ncbi:phosphoribosylformimino-5-aminoimidazole carboxamide ribotide isomerase [Desulfurivibrio alkaliphilus]|uniref:Phosphoribosylformimino-5-aminoimidazole carboxamide ribotide isomerase n=1 Tax=Desulfurivibrio alkaliphilus (strain DSM 19089 / UNIQEM U267 / AHT2) TaxID=589865 RepID=D6Z6X1_DESAT|nr:phosphoribosylformimino-5-aminoimidazole carboxamide ribotide isomerase [Desulfurivibrio alkaliphilus]ADH86958.1 phosphoribosylformimino-5-aminoimidazole carboxamide ribotide isomerase [Desulfurivibrio alkaliphilus AHT 2]
MKFRPCIDLHEGKVKQIVGSTLSDSDQGSLATNFVAEQPPSYYAELYRRDNLNGGHVIMLGPGNEAAAAEALAAWPGGLQLGGGITADNAGRWLDLGAEAVIVTSYVFRDGQVLEERLRRLVKAVGRERLVLDLSCRRRDGRFLVVTDRWQKFTSMAVDATSLEYFSRFCCEFLVHAVDVEGKCAGVAEDLLTLLAAATPLPTTYAGGVASLDDLYRIKELGRDRLDATIGSALDIFGGTGVQYRDAVAFNREGQRQ